MYNVANLNVQQIYNLHFEMTIQIANDRTDGSKVMMETNNRGGTFTMQSRPLVNTWVKLSRFLSIVVDINELTNNANEFMNIRVGSHKTVSIIVKSISTQDTQLALDTKRWIFIILYVNASERNYSEKFIKLD